MLSLLVLHYLHAAIVEKPIEYKEGNTTLEGYLVYDYTKSGKMPGVIVVHAWMGLNDYAKSRAKQLAEMGYVAFAADIYGKGVFPKDTKEASDLSSKYKSDVALLRKRVQAALKTLKAQKNVDSSNTAAIGYCFGGTTVLELARSGADVKGVVSFHGGLSTPNSKDAKKIKSKVLVLHGAIDPYVKPEEVASFQQEMNDASVDYQFVAYSGAVHSFTEPAAGKNVKSGAAYNEKADKRSFEAMKSFFAEIFSKK
jgi:dienelactone hydrolase